MSAPALADQYLNVNQTLGLVFLGCVFSSILYGVTCVQTWLYASNYPKDPLHLKLLVAVVWALDTAHSASVMLLAWELVIKNWGNIEGMLTLNRGQWADVPLSGIIALIVKSFLIWRVYILSRKNLPLVIFLSVILAADFSLYIVYYLQAAALTNFTQVHSVVPMGMALDGLTAADDVILAGVLTYLLRSSRNGFEKSDRMLNKLIYFTVNNGLLTSLCALAVVISLKVDSSTQWFTFFFISLGKLYCNTLLATLNARTAVTEKYTGDTSVTFPMSSTGAKRNPMQESVTINIDRSVNYGNLEKGITSTFDDGYRAD